MFQETVFPNCFAFLSLVIRLRFSRRKPGFKSETKELAEKKLFICCSGMSFIDFGFDCGKPSNDAGLTFLNNLQGISDDKINSV